MRHRSQVHWSIDSVAWALALTCATFLRFDLAASADHLHALALLIPLAAVVQAGTGVALKLYTGRWRFGSFDEVLALVGVVVMTTSVLTVASFVSPAVLGPRSVPGIASAIALGLMGGARYIWRLALEKRRRPTGDACQRLLVFGAGEGGAQVVVSMLRDPLSPYLPVALLDDDVAKGNLSIMGIRVVGSRHRLAEAAVEHNADTLLIAVPTAGAPLVTELNELAREAGLKVKVLPAVSELFTEEVGLGDIRDITAADLLGRHEINTDVASIAGYLTGRRVLVTGAGGSIGSELCRQIYNFAPAELIMVDRDESALHGVQLSIDNRPTLESPNLVLLDLRDRTAVARLLEERRPEVIFHAAALKHVTLLERHPAEAVKTNVWGTLDLLELAVTHGVERFVNISTDKAADPISVLGYSKRITERLTTHFAARTNGTFLSVRFGNVLGSRGSMLTTFEAQIAAGGPVTVTHPEVTRYFMTIEEAVQLVVQAGAIGRSGEALVFDMGEPVQIAEVARLLAARSERHIEIEFTHLRPGEKLHEVLLGANEIDFRPVHPLISHVDVPPLAPERARRALSTPHEAMPEALRRLCHEPVSPDHDLTVTAERR